MERKVRPHPLLGIFVMTVLAVGIYYHTEHHWPNSFWFLGWIVGWIMMVGIDTFQYVVKLMERQNALLEQVLGVLKADRHEYEEPLGRR